MSDYSKSTNFTAKDTLPTGNSGKIVKGTELDIEFTAIASAITSKANSDNAALTGVPTAPTASAGTSTTQIATTAFATSAINALGNMSAQNKSAVDITGGTIVGITDLAVADGGTGSSTLSANAVLLGNGTSALQTVAPGTSGNVLTSNGTTWVSQTPPFQTKYQLFTSSGTWTAPAGVTNIKVTLFGAGGGSGYNNSWGGAAPGGKGGVAVAYLTVTGGTAYTITVGTGGSGGTSGSNGGNTSFSTLLSATGGTGGYPSGSGNVSGTDGVGNIKTFNNGSLTAFSFGFIGPFFGLTYTPDDVTGFTTWAGSSGYLPGAGGNGSYQHPASGVGGVVLVEWMG